MSKYLANRFTNHFFQQNLGVSLSAIAKMFYRLNCLKGTSNFIFPLIII